MRKVKPNSKILFLAFGGGLTGAAAVIDWGGRSHALKPLMKNCLIVVKLQ